MVVMSATVKMLISTPAEDPVPFTSTEIGKEKLGFSGAQYLMQEVTLEISRSVSVIVSS